MQVLATDGVSVLQSKTKAEIELEVQHLIQHARFMRRGRIKEGKNTYGTEIYMTPRRPQGRWSVTVSRKQNRATKALSAVRGALPAWPTK